MQFRFALVDVVRRYAKGRAAARLCFDQDQGLVVGRDQINFRPGGAKITLQNPTPSAPQILLCDICGAPSERDSLPPR
jgi:hypothetical protein